MEQLTTDLLRDSSFVLYIFFQPLQMYKYFIFIFIDFLLIISIGNRTTSSAIRD